MPTIIGGRHQPGCSGERSITLITGSSARQVAGSLHDMRPAALALMLSLAACAAPGSVASSPYHAPNEADIAHAGGGGGGGAGGGM